MERMVENYSEAPAVLDESKNTIDLVCQFASKLQSILKQVSRSPIASFAWKDSTCVVKSIRGPSPELRSELDKEPWPSFASVAPKSSTSDHASARELYSKLGQNLKRNSKSSGALTKSKDSSSTEMPQAGSLFKLFSRLEKNQPNVHCPLKRPIMKPGTYPGPSKLAELCKSSTIQLIPAKELDTLSQYWHFRDNLDRLARQSYRQGEEIACLLRCTKSSPSSLGLNQSLIGAHKALHMELHRLHHCIEKEEAHLEETMARTVFTEMKNFMERLEAFTADCHLACSALQDIFDKAIISEGGLQGRVQNPRTVFPEAWEHRFIRLCWDLRREIEPLIDATSRGGRECKSTVAEVAAVADETRQMQSQTDRTAYRHINLSHFSKLSRQ